jgi:hypothetical protein
MSHKPPVAPQSVPVLEQQDAPGVALDIPEPSPAPEASVASPAPAPDADAITFQSMADRLTPGLLAAVIGAVLVFISAFLTWSTVDARSEAGGKIAGAVTDSIGLSGGRLGTATLVLAIAALAMVGVMLLPSTKPWAWQALLGFGLLSAFFALIDLISIPRTLRPENFTCPDGVTCTFHRTLGPGVWFTLVASLVIVAGAYVHHIRPVPFRSPGAPSRQRRPKTVDLTKKQAV